MKWLFLASVLLLAGCASPVSQVDIAVASYPSYFLVSRLAGDDLSVANLASHIEPHEYQPTPRDVAQMRAASHVIIWDPVLEPWAAESAVRLKTTSEADPHTWLDPILMAEAGLGLASQMKSWYPEHADAIEARADGLAAELFQLHVAFQEGMRGCKVSTIATAHDAYSYLGARYNFSIVSLEGTTPGGEPSPQDIQRVIKVIRDQKLKVFFIEEETDPSTVAAIQEETGVAVRVLATLETQPETGNYVTVQIKNRDALREALQCQ